MPKRNHIKIAAAVVVLSLLCTTIIFSRINKNQEENVLITYRDYLLDSFISELPEINKNLPHKIDNNTILLSINYINDKIVSQYQLIGINHDSSLIDDFKKNIEPILRNQICLDKIKGRLLDVEVEFLEKYHDSRGIVIFEMTVNKSDCRTINQKNFDSVN